MGQIDLDPASCEYANNTIKADEYFTESDNGLDREWYGRIWLNPPYSQTGKFVEKLLESNFEEAIILTNNATETGWFRQLAKAADAIVFHTGRLRFEKPGSVPTPPMQGQAFIYFGAHPDLFLFPQFFRHLKQLFRIDPDVRDVPDQIPRS